jgi:hypothetical protein
MFDIPSCLRRWGDPAETIAAHAPPTAVTRSLSSVHAFPFIDL